MKRSRSGSGKLWIAEKMAAAPLPIKVVARVLTKYAREVRGSGFNRFTADDILADIGTYLREFVVPCLANARPGTSSDRVVVNDPLGRSWVIADEGENGLVVISFFTTASRERTK